MPCKEDASTVNRFGSSRKRKDGARSATNASIVTGNSKADDDQGDNANNCGSSKCGNVLLQSI